jgi:hypothetical protein
MGPNSTLKKNSLQTHSIQLPPQSQFGDYSVNVSLVYLDENQMMIVTNRTLGLSYVNLIDDWTTIDNRGSPRITISIRTFFEIMDFRLILEPNDNFGVEWIEVNETLLEPGDHHYYSRIFKKQTPYNTGELRYHIYGSIGGRPIEHHSKTVSVPFLDMDNEDGLMYQLHENPYLTTLLIAVTFIGLIGFNYYYYMKKR